MFTLSAEERSEDEEAKEEAPPFTLLISATRHQSNHLTPSHTTS